MSEYTQRAVLLHLPRNKPIDIEFDNITYTVSNNGKKGKKQVLKSISGKFLSGELTAVMGPSGAGKSSLLNILTGFQTSGMGGSIRSSGNNQHKKGSSQYKKESCYILQDDRLSPLFTVDEIMHMATDLKLGYSLSEKAKHLVVDDVLDTLGLSACKETRCEKLSGGQKKRLSIALELVDNPPIMFLDEPTTGLDSSSSLQCISMLKALARGGRTIVCTIHQPSATIYEMFDHVYILAEGNCIYQGASTNTVPYLSSVGLQCPQYHNPADYLLEVANGEYGSFTEQLSQASMETNWRKVVRSPKLDIVQETNGYSDTAVNKTMVLIQPPSEWIKFWVLLNRSLLQLYRDWTVTHLKFLVHMVVGTILGLLYFNSGGDGSKTISNVGYMMVSAVYLCYTSMMPAVLKFPSELPVLKKERFNNWYCLKTYYAAYLVSGIPTQILLCSVYTSISYFMSAQPQDWTRFAMFLGTCILITLTSEGMGLVLGTTVNPINGTFLGAILTAVMLVMAGFLILFNHMPTYMYLFSYLSYLRYGLQGLMQAVYGDRREPLSCPDSILYCHYKAPKVLLDEFGMNNNCYWTNMIALLAMLICFRLVAFCTLKRSLSCG